MFNLDAGVLGLEGGNAVDKGLVAGVALRGDGPQGQGDIVCERGGRADAEQ